MQYLMLVRVDPDLDEAIDLAATHPTSAVERIEIRPMVVA